jgi:ABC-2 type transport system ATP-binding protein
MIEIKNLSFGYGKEALFSNLDLSAAPGNIYGLLGKNGAGKTTLLKLLAGLRFLQDGECEVLGYDPRKRPPSFLEDLFFLPEEFSLVEVSVVKFERLYAPFYPRFSPDLFHEYLDEFELDDRKNLKAYSFGQVKKFLLAFGLARRPRLMLLDEPTNGLDIPSKRQFRKILASALTDDQIVIISTHQARDLENLIDPVIILDEGRVIFNQFLEEISNRLTIQVTAESPKPGESLYTEETVTGYSAVVENTDGDEARVDLEILFNAVTSNAEGISRIFKEGGAR